jgi:hypothetical protein
MSGSTYQSANPATMPPGLEVETVTQPSGAQRQVVSVGDAALPTGAATSAKQDTQIGYYSDLVETRTQTPTKTKALNVQIGPGDLISNLPVIVDLSQHQIHEGESHSYEYYSATPATMNFAIVVPVYANTIQAPHLIMQMECYGGAGMISLYEGATYTGGTPSTAIFNRNRNSATTPKTGFSIVEGVTSTDGTKLPYTEIVGAAEKTSGSGRGIDEVVLKSNTTYVLRFEEITAMTRLIIHLEWYEDLGV